MLHPGRTNLEQAESEAVDKLMEKHPDATVSFTRRDAGESGPLLVSVDEDVYVVQPDGATRKKAN